MRFDGNFYNGIIKNVVIRTGMLNFRTGNAEPNIANITLDNSYQMIEGSYRRLSDFIYSQNYLNQDVTIHWWTEKNTALSECPIVFAGLID